MPKKNLYSFLLTCCIFSSTVAVNNNLPPLIQYILFLQAAQAAAVMHNPNHNKPNRNLPKKRVKKQLSKKVFYSKKTNKKNKKHHRCQ